MEDHNFSLERAANNILDDERLTAGLDDETADYLLEWGLALVAAAAADTNGLDSEGVTEITQPRIKAIKGLLRLINDWLQNGDDWDLMEKEDRLSRILIVAGLAYGTDLRFARKTGDEESMAPGLEALLSKAVGLEGNSVEKANALRKLIEGNDWEMTDG